MSASEAREELLKQHQRLRHLLAGAEDLARQVLAGAEVVPVFSGALTVLRTELAAHNAAEEAALVPLLRAGDAYGAARVQRMFEEHAGEHAVLLAALDGTPAVVAGRMAEVAEDLRAHMEAEERTILHPKVLR